MKNKYLEKAAQQVLAEVLGYDEGKVYYLILTKQENELEKEFSYSKKYRLLKSLFELGAVGKIKSEGKDFFSYILLPPTFLYEEKVDKEITEFLEKIYLENYKYIFKRGFSQMILREEKSLLLFLLKYFMKKQARLMMDELDKSILEGKSRKVCVIKNKEEKRRIGIIDRNFAFEFVSVLTKRNYEYVGYLASNGKEGENKEKGKDYVSLVEEELNT